MPPYGHSRPSLRLEHGLRHATKDHNDCINYLYDHSILFFWNAEVHCNPHRFEIFSFADTHMDGNILVMGAVSHLPTI